MIVILAIESSCDETSASVLVDGKVLSNKIASQSVHEAYGGVVPELASRAHQQHILPIVHEALKEAKVQKAQVSAVAFTKGPGLLGSLMVGGAFAKSLAYAWGVPLLAVHHTRAHILSHFIEPPYPQFPFLCLTVSGGHTQLVLVKDYLDMEIVGQTTDDAVGEAFDKTAKLLGLPYPGGPLIDRYAQQGNAHAFTFAKVKPQGLNFSFSGIKTSILYFLRDQVKSDPDFVEKKLPDICASVQKTLVDMLMAQLLRASEQFNIGEIAIAGGVSANSGLRQAVESAAQEHGWRSFVPRFEYCTDNAAMIATAGYYQFQQRQFAGLDSVPEARWPFEEGNKAF